MSLLNRATFKALKILDLALTNLDDLLFLLHSTALDHTTHVDYNQVLTLLLLG